MAEARIESWGEVLRKWRRQDAPWLILPRRPYQSNECLSLSYRELYERAVPAAHVLRASCESTARVVVIADSSAECCLSIFAALIAGLTLVPVAPRSLGRPHAAWHRDIEALLHECTPAVLLGPEPEVRALPPQQGVAALSFRALFEQSAGYGGQHTGSIEPSRVAIWQYTSGTTGTARAVELTHTNLLSNIASIGSKISATERDVGASWLPLFHDMGLIGSLLFSCYWGMPLVLMPPRAFVARPEAWLWAIARFRATCSAAPNSAYEICASKIGTAMLNGLDLASWRVAFNGAEFVHPSTIQRFCERFRSHGFRAQAMYPVYGLAEHTVAGCLPERMEGAEFDWIDGAELERNGRALSVEPESAGARAITSVGMPLQGHELRIVEGQTRVSAGERMVGEIELLGPSRMRGYRGEPNCFAPGGWLRTGDLGYLANGKLHVVGRIKHVIKRGGKLLDAGRIESAARVVSGVRNGIVAAFGVPDSASGTEQLVVLAESVLLDDDAQRVLRGKIAEATMAAVSVVPDVIALVRPGSIPRTTSGKVQHTAARQHYLEGTI